MDQQLQVNVVILCKQIAEIMAAKDVTDRRKAIETKRIADRISAMMEPIVYNGMERYK